MEVKEQHERCSCGGEIDCIHILEDGVWEGKCFRCGIKYTVIKKIKGQPLEPNH